VDGLRVKFAAAVTGALVAVPGGGGVDGIPDRALVAYVTAADGAPCDLPWYVLAAVGAVETGHGTHGGAHLQDDGTMSVMAVSDADAYGPMQFIEPTWAHYGRGDINDIDDAAPAAARLLCANGYEADPTNAIGAYNGGAYWRRYAESRRYVELVDEYAQEYAQADPKAVTVGAKTGKERTPQRLWDRLVVGWLRVGAGAKAIGAGGAWEAVDDAAFGEAEEPVRLARVDGLNPVFGERLEQFIAAAPGEITVVSGFRSGDEQMALRRQNCPDPVYSHSTECTPWTAKPGTSDHESGFAADLAYQDDATKRWAHANASNAMTSIACFALSVRGFSLGGGA
jgi:hypothetical protein